MKEWRYLADDGAGAAEGLALDEALMEGHGRGRPSASPVLRLYTYASHAALCGRFQHLEAEIDVERCRATGTAFNRRPTGGGAIVMGAGQLGVAVTAPAPAADRPKTLLLRFSDGIVAGLARLGIEAQFGGKNDLKVGRRKIAGLGLYIDGDGGMLFHASVLADLDVPFMLDVLSIPAAKLGSRAVEAVGERVTTVSGETGQAWTGERLREVVAAGFAEALEVDLQPGRPSGRELDLAADLVRGKYETSDWLFQRSPHLDATATATLKAPGGLIRVYLALSGSTIKSALFTGDFNEIPAPLVAYEAALKWARCDQEELRLLARATCATGTELGIEPEALADLVWSAATRSAATETAAPPRTGSCYFPDRPGVDPQLKEVAR